MYVCCCSSSPADSDHQFSNLLFQLNNKPKSRHKVAETSVVKKESFVWRLEVQVPLQLKNYSIGYKKWM